MVDVINRLLIRYPIFATIIMNTEFKKTSLSVPAVLFTDGVCVYYKENEFNKFSDDEKEFVVAHELFHIILKHSYRNPCKDKDLLNFVEDAIINQMLLEDGLKVPKSAVLIDNALKYSTEELYMKYLPMINEIKEFMKNNTYHPINDTISNKMDIDITSSKESNKSRDTFNEEYYDEIRERGIHGKNSFGTVIDSSLIDKNKSLLEWRDLLKLNLNTFDEKVVMYYEVDRDGLVRKEEKNDKLDYESEIIIDSSGSMNFSKIKRVLSECKNILSNGEIKVGFCDCIFYGFNKIESDEDIDKLSIIGRGGTDFYKMANSFSSDVDNKIVITDGWGEFPNNCNDVLWIIINSTIPLYINDNVNYIFIDENSIYEDSMDKKLVKRI